MSVGLPKARTAAYRASFEDSPRSRCSSSSNSRSDRSSRSRSAFFFVIRHHGISALLRGGPHHARYGFGHLLPLRFFDHELLLAFIGQAVVFKFPIAVGRSLPFGDHPSSFLQAVQGWIERTVLHLQKLVRGSLNVLADLMTVSRAIKKRPQDEHVKSALEKARALLLLCLLRHRRQSTLNPGAMVDARPSLVKGWSRRWILTC